MSSPREKIEEKERKKSNKYLKTLLSIGLLCGAEVNYNIVGKAANIFFKRDRILKEVSNYLNGTVKEEYTTEEILEGIENNPRLTEEEKEIFREMEYLIEDNPFVLSKETYYSVSGVDIDYGEGQVNNVLGYYIYELLKIIVLEDDAQNSTLKHEIIHCLFTNDFTIDLPNYFIEGATKLEENEYFKTNPYVEIYSYAFELCMVKLLCNMVGPSKVLEAYTIGDMDIIKDELVYRSDNYDEGTKEVAAEEFLNNVDRVFTCYENGEKIPESSFENMIKYLNEYFINHYEMNSDLMDEFFYYRGVLNLLVEDNPAQKYFDYLVENGYYERPYFSSKLRAENNLESIKDEYNKQKINTPRN